MVAPIPAGDFSCAGMAKVVGRDLAAAGCASATSAVQASWLYVQVVRFHEKSPTLVRRTGPPWGTLAELHRLLRKLLFHTDVHRRFVYGSSVVPGIDGEVVCAGWHG